MNSWEIAQKEGKTIITGIIGMMVGVYYPYRRTGDLYVVHDNTAHCCQCEKDFPVSDFFNHVNSHNKQLKKYPDFIVDNALVKIPEGETEVKIEMEG
jgi:hypothetical protein